MSRKPKPINQETASKLSAIGDVKLSLTAVNELLALLRKHNIQIQDFNYDKLAMDVGHASELLDAIYTAISIVNIEVKV